MSRVTIAFNTDNDAFQHGMGSNEATHVLKDVVSAIEAGFTNGHCIDSNGNVIGKWSARYPKD